MRRKLLISLAFLIAQCVFLIPFASADIIDEAFRPSLNNDTVINLGQDKDAVGNRVFKGGLDITIGGDDAGVNPSDSLLVTITKTLLRLTLILGVTMTIRNGIKLVLAAGDDAKMKTAVKNIGYIALGILLALGSVAIIYLLTSVGKSIF